MNRIPFLATLAAVVALTASVAYWSLQLFKPAQRPIAAPPVQEAAAPSMDAARGLFGGQVAVAAVSTYQLRGVVAARNGQRSVAIISANGEAPKAYPVGKEVAAGITVQDVQPRFVTLLDGGVSKRLDLPPDDGASMTTSAALPAVVRAAPLPQQPQPAPAPSATPLVTPPPGTPVGPPGQVAPVQTAPAQRPATSQ